MRLLSLAFLVACQPEPAPVAPPAPAPEVAPPAAASYSAQHANDFVKVQLKADLSTLAEADRRMVGLLVQASQVMDELFWKQSWGDKQALLAQIPDAETRALAEMNYGPWDRLNGDTPFVDGIGPRPPGMGFYPADMTKEEFEAADLKDKASWYTLIRRGPDGKLVTVPYHVEYKADLEKAASLLREAAKHSTDATFGKYLEMRADALLTDDFRPSDMAWMDMKTNPVDVVIGPIESYEDQIFGYKAAYEGLVLIKDRAWSERLAKFAAFLPELQRGLPVPEKYKAEMPGSDADLNAYTVVYYGGNANVGERCERTRVQTRVFCFILGVSSVRKNHRRT